MQRWWIVVAAVFGVGLAVLLIPRPDTGGDLGDGSSTELTAGIGPVVASDHALVTGPRGPRGPQPVGDGAAPAPKMNPIAAQVEARRSGPEVTFASRTLAPWTQIRRLIALKELEDDESTALVEDANQITRDMRTLRRDPQTMDFDEFEAKQQALITRIRSSGAHDEEIEKYLSLVEERFGEYHSSGDGAEVITVPE